MSKGEPKNCGTKGIFRETRIW